MTLLARGTFCERNCHRAHERLQDKNLNEQKQKSCSAFGVLEVKIGLDRTGKKKMHVGKKQQKCMHWNMILNALPGSATIGSLVN